MLLYNDDDDFLNKKLYINHKTRRKSWQSFKASGLSKSKGCFPILKQKLKLDFSRKSLKRRQRILKLFSFRFSSNTANDQFSHHPITNKKNPQIPFQVIRLSLRNYETLSHSNLNASQTSIINISSNTSYCVSSSCNTKNFSISHNATSAKNDLKQRLALRKRYLRRKRKRKFNQQRQQWRQHHLQTYWQQSKISLDRNKSEAGAALAASSHIHQNLNSHQYQSLNRNSKLLCSQRQRDNNLSNISNMDKSLCNRYCVCTNFDEHFCNISGPRTGNNAISNNISSKISNIKSTIGHYISNNVSNFNSGSGNNFLDISDNESKQITYSSNIAGKSDCNISYSSSNNYRDIGNSFSRSASNKFSKTNRNTSSISSNISNNFSNISSNISNNFSNICNRNNNYNSNNNSIIITLKVMFLSLVHLSLTTIATLYANAVTTLSKTAQHIVSAVIAATTLPIIQRIQQLLQHQQQQHIQQLQQNLPQTYLQQQHQQNHQQLQHLQQQTLQQSQPESESQSQQQTTSAEQPLLHTQREQMLQRCHRRELPLATKGLNKYSWIFLLIYLNLSAKVCLAGYNEKRLLHDLLDTYNTLERPVLNESDPLQLSFGLTLMQIIDVDEKNQLLVTNVWLKLEWNDMNLRWNTSDYGGIKDLRIPPHRIWKPDVLMYNSADEGFDGTYQTNVVVRNNGSCLYVPPGIFKSTCKIDITWFPFDDQRCEMKFGSWTYDGFQLDLQLQDETGGDISSYVLNGEWELLGVPGKRNEIYYNCCPEPYIDITFAIIIRRRTLYYFFNLIIPCVLIASMALLGFTLPPDSGEKLSLGVTILLSLTVFLNMVAETMPATSDAVPLLGTYFNCIMFMVASSVVSTILILNYHHRNADTHEMSEWIRVVFLCWLPWILRMHRPGRPIIMDFTSTPCSDTSSERKHQILSDVELKERSSKSLLANVLDIDDDFRNVRPMTPGGTLPHNPAFYRTVYGQGDDGSIGPIGSTRMPDAVTHHTCIKTQTEYELSLILKEIRFITDQLRKEDEENDIANDWKFAAMVVDRLCLIIFTMFTILATIAVLLSAPHIIVS